jgi:hypothetical protein
MWMTDTASTGETKATESSCARSPAPQVTALDRELLYLKRFHMLTRSMARPVAQVEAQESDRVQREADPMSEDSTVSGDDEPAAKPAARDNSQEEADRVQREAEMDEMSTSSDDDEPMAIEPQHGAAEAAANPVPGPKKPEALDVPFPRWMAEQQRADPFLHGLITKLETKAGEPPAEPPADAENPKYEFLGAS